ncbi:hypothetical protein [Spirosoma utsteinense]|uniref:Uncharacterized protein n=1 Tax=Spirosoma utsteinense TaxID=2585773 RepID=A0ABR6WEU6_9BACT|nr:hypothetical protein [Spirosoma utsteinense]MBC3787449.1 hypothetical protein [Spirosoma utsteinense]MBC3794531.1 hypothetical protein [Spirosoma utsteinense]
MKDKFDNRTQLLPTKVLLQLGLDGRTISSSAYPSFGFGGRDSVGHLVLNINI